MNTTLCNMCMIQALDGRVLVQHRLPKSGNARPGLSFPDVHVKTDESVTAATIREVREETGLEVTGLPSCGFIEWWNPERQSLYIVFLFRTSQYTGELRSSAEGQMEWVMLEQMRAGKMAPNMEKYLRVFMEDKVPECFGISGKKLTVIEEK